MRGFLSKQVDDLIDNGPELVKATLALIVGITVILVFAFKVGLVAYVVAMWVSAVLGGVCLFRASTRPIGKGLLAAASGTLSFLPLFVFGAIFSSLG